MGNAIRLISNGRLEEDKAAAIFSPGHLVKKNSSGELIKHNVEGGFAERSVATEDALQGKTTSDAYAVGEVASYWIPHSGDEMQYLLLVGETVAIGDQLISNGDGTLIPVASATSAGVVVDVIGIAVEALDLSASGAVDTLLAVRVL